jgi:acetoin utilization protein AcuB
MTFWIYNYGLAVPLSEQRLQVQRKTAALDKLTRSKQVRDTDNPTMEAKVVASAPATTELETSYQKSINELRHQVFRSDQIMSTPVVSFTDSTTFIGGWRQFSELKYRHFPVIDKSARLIGIVSDRDMLTEAAANEIQASSVRKRKNIRQLMNKKVLTATAETPIRECCRVMFSHHVGALPITNEQGKLLGILTRSDILRAMIKHEPIELWI